MTFSTKFVNNKYCFWYNVTVFHLPSSRARISHRSHRHLRHQPRQLHGPRDHRHRFASRNSKRFGNSNCLLPNSERFHVFCSLLCTNVFCSLLATLSFVRLDICSHRHLFAPIWTFVRITFLYLTNRLMPIQLQ